MRVQPNGLYARDLQASKAWKYLLVSTKLFFQRCCVCIQYSLFDETRSDLSTRSKEISVLAMCGLEGDMGRFISKLK